MRLVGALLLAVLTGSVAFAEEASPPPSSPSAGETQAAPAEAAPTPTTATSGSTKSRVPLRVVRMLAETHQVLLLDKNRGTHVVAEVGQEVDGYIVDEITDDEVTLIAPSGAEVILAAPDMTWRRRAAERKAAAAKKGVPAAAIVTTAPSADGAASSAESAAPTTAGPVDPYAEAPAAAPADPYADYDPGIAAFVDAVDAQPAPAPARAKPAKKQAPAATGGADIAGGLAAAVTGEPAPAPAPAPAGSTDGAAGAAGGAATSITLPRADVDAALSDFGATAVTFDAKFVADGLRIDSIATGTILAKAGLKKGDTITAVDGKPLRSFDDAADLYARMQTARAATVNVQRAGKPVTLKVSIR